MIAAYLKDGRIIAAVLFIAFVAAGGRSDPIEADVLALINSPLKCPSDEFHEQVRALGDKYGYHRVITSVIAAAESARMPEQRRRVLCIAIRTALDFEEDIILQTVLDNLDSNRRFRSFISFRIAGGYRCSDRQEAFEYSGRLYNLVKSDQPWTRAYSLSLLSVIKDGDKSFEALFRRSATEDPSFAVRFVAIDCLTVPCLKDDEATRLAKDDEAARLFFRLFAEAFPKHKPAEAAYWGTKLTELVEDILTSEDVRKVDSLTQLTFPYEADTVDLKVWALAAIRTQEVKQLKPVVEKLRDSADPIIAHQADLVLRLWKAATTGEGVRP